MRKVLWGLAAGLALAGLGCQDAYENPHDAPYGGGGAAGAQGGRVATDPLSEDQPIREAPAQEEAPAEEETGTGGSGDEQGGSREEIQSPNWSGGEVGSRGQRDPGNEQGLRQGKGSLDPGLRN